MRAALCLVAACSYTRGVPAGASDGAIAGSDAPALGSDAPAGSCVSYGTGLVQPCFRTAPTGAMTFGSMIDTDSVTCATVTGMNVANVCVLGFQSVTFNG